MSVNLLALAEKILAQSRARKALAGQVPKQVPRQQAKKQAPRQQAKKQTPRQQKAQKSNQVSRLAMPGQQGFSWSAHAAAWDAARQFSGRAKKYRVIGEEVASEYQLDLEDVFPPFPQAGCMAEFVSSMEEHGLSRSSSENAFRLVFEGRDPQEIMATFGGGGSNNPTWAHGESFSG
jgi:hypothetical protein